LRHGLKRAGGWSVERDGAAVDREISTPQVLLKSCRLDLRQRTGMGIALAAAARDVERVPLEGDGGRAEAIVTLNRATELRGKQAGVGVDDEIELSGIALEQQVPDR